ncbi:MerR family transcriptional regulator [Companilactobacillus nuruki]|uniref:MerR family transcriptional regulator n=1 Tax=Companilactobacillus nuruki TaxID=1993540 RepID=A0A2N7AWK4_9LACO|nr:MerR family transcriptional regulator [Companilactobacillus nuruki]PMD73124.1 MerR family transcriptional regulator [Companilactobacillus nuruki]
MEYTMSEVCKKFNISEYTMRYYDKIDLIPGVYRNEQNRRIFTDDSVGWIRFVIALRSTGMPIADVKKYIDLTAVNNNTSIQARLDMLEKQANNADKQLADIQKQHQIIADKIEHYKQSMQKSPDLTKKPYQRWV